MGNQTLECAECGKTESSFVNPFLQHANGADYEPAIHYLCNADRQARRQTRAIAKLQADVGLPEAV